MLASLYMIFIYVPTEASMGFVQRIFYFHVPLAWAGFPGFLCGFSFQHPLSGEKRFQVR